MAEEEILVGITEIAPHVGNVSNVTILKWKQEYDDFPIRKLGGQWVSEKAKLVEWFQRFCADK